MPQLSKVDRFCGFKAREPLGFLFDEPLSNLDAALRVQMRLEIARLHETLKTTMVYVTHDQVEAMTLADKIVVLRDGLIMQVGTPRELYERPANLFVAQFIGSPKMNVLNCSADGGKFSLPGHGSDTHTLGALGKDVTVLGIRPEHIDISDNKDAHCSGTVEVAEYLGSDTFLNVNCEGLGSITVRAEAAASRLKGQKVSLRFQPENVHFFSSAEQALLG